MDMLDRDAGVYAERTSMAAVMTLSNGALRDVVVEDFSFDGACVRSNLRVGETVAISLPRIGTFEAAVCWARGGRSGLLFARPHPTQFRQPVFNEAES